jgi:2-haloacid dehalogenase
VLRDGIALSTAGTFRTFREVAAGTLHALIAELGNRPDPARVDEALQGFDELPAFRDVSTAMTALAESGVRRAVVSNASAQTLAALLGHAGIKDKIEVAVSIDEVRRWKPAPEPYRRALEALGLPARQVAYVSAHPWDVEGARAAGMFGVLLQRRGGHLQPAMPPPDLTIAALAELVQIGAQREPLA